MLNYWLDTDQEDHDEAPNLSDSLKVGRLRQTSICIPFGRFLSFFFLRLDQRSPWLLCTENLAALRLTTSRPRPIISLSQPSAGTVISSAYLRVPSDIQLPPPPECHQTFSSSPSSFLSCYLRLPPIRSGKAGIYFVGSEDRFTWGCIYTIALK